MLLKKQRELEEAERKLKEEEKKIAQMAKDNEEKRKR